MQEAADGGRRNDSERPSGSGVSAPPLSLGAQQFRGWVRLIEAVDELVAADVDGVAIQGVVASVIADRWGPDPFDV